MNSSSISSARCLFVTGFFLLLFGTLVLHPATGIAQQKTLVGGHHISGPYHYKNLSIFLVHGKDKITGRNIVTLEEGLARGIVKVYETGSVNELQIENLSNDTEVYVQAGDIVKGGQQDRTLGVDLTLQPNSGSVPITSFCVERGRWTQRGEESSAEFSSSTAVVASNDLRLAIRGAKDQGEVWENVDVMQAKLSENIGVQVNALGGTVPYRQPESSLSITQGAVALVDTVQRVQFEFSPQSAAANARIELGDITGLLNGEIVDGEYEVVRSANGRTAGIISQEYVNDYDYVDGYSNGVETTTSLQLSLENAELIDEVEEYMAALQKIVAAHDDVIGFAFTINGEMKNADLYGSRDLFGKLWPKLLRAAATEAVSEQSGDDEEQVGSIDAVSNCFLDAEKAEAEQEEIGDRVIMVTRKSDENILFETQEKGSSEWLHRNYMKLELE